MTTAELAKKLNYRIVTCESKAAENAVTGVYTCDLLSHAMAKINGGDLWITVHTNLNVIAVASLAEAACVLIPESIEIDQQIIERAEEKEVVLLSGSASAAQACRDIFSAIDCLP